MNDKQKNKNKIYYMILSVVAIICIVAIIGILFINNKNENEEETELAYTELIKKIDNKEVFVFIQTNELMQELNSKFEEGSFLLSKTLKF